MRHDTNDESDDEDDENYDDCKGIIRLTGVFSDVHSPGSGFVCFSSAQW